MWRKFRLKTLFRLLWPVALGLFFCEYLIYFPVLWRCQYPELKSHAEEDDVLKVMFLADTHLLGSRNGHWFDKLRREWQMRRSFQTARALFAPDLVVFLGDVFDEGKWCGPDEFNRYAARFEELFAVDTERTEVRVVAGNHDLGFHYAVTPYLHSRFERAFGAPSVDLFSAKGVTFVAVNSMAMEGDGCFLCEDAKKRLAKVAERLECMGKGGKDSKKCEGVVGGGESFARRPILLQHYPLYRRSDADCMGDEDEDWAPPGKERESRFREGWECVSRESSRHLLKALDPRLVLSGHTHHGCRMLHGPEAVPEWSVSSFSWRNRNNPTFLLASITTEEFAIEKCFLPQETTVINLYWLMAVLYLACILKRQCFNRRMRSWWR